MKNQVVIVAEFGVVRRHRRRGTTRKWGNSRLHKDRILCACARNFDTVEKCQAAVATAHEGFTCSGKYLVGTGTGSPLGNFDNVQQCQAAVAEAHGNSPTKTAVPNVSALSSCMKDLQEAKAHDPSITNAAVRNQYDAVFSALKKLESIDTRPAN